MKRTANSTKQLTEMIQQLNEIIAKVKFED